MLTANGVFFWDRRMPRHADNFAGRGIVSMRKERGKKRFARICTIKRNFFLCAKTLRTGKVREEEKSMILQGIRNYLKSLKYVFVPMGVLFFGLVLGLSVSLPQIVSILKDFAEGTQRIFGESTLSGGEMVQSLWARVTELDWSNPLGALAQLLESAWLNETLEKCVKPFVEDYDRHAAEMQQLIRESADGIVRQALVTGVLAALGLACGLFLTQWMVRREIARRGFRKLLPGMLFDAVFATLLLIVCTRISVKPGWGFAAALAALLLFGAAALMEAYLLHGRKVLPFRSVVTLKNSCKLLVSNAAIYVMTAAIVAAVGGVLNEIAGLCIALPLFGIAFFVIGMNAESYVIGKVKELAGKEN